MTKKVMGFDASTTTIGIAVIEYDESNAKLIHVEHYKPPKKGDLIERLAQVREFVAKQINEFNPDEIVIEDIILFMKGRSTAKTISSLAVLNRTVGLAVYNFSGKLPQLFNVMKIRHTLKLDSKLPSKEEMPAIIEKRLNIEFPWKYKTKKDGSKVVMEESYDMCDAISVALTFIECEKKGNSSKVKKVKKVKKGKSK